MAMVASPCKVRQAELPVGITAMSKTFDMWLETLTEFQVRRATGQETDP